jgi:hypothetical protein
MSNKNYQLIFDEDKVLIGIYEPSVGCIPIDQNNRDYKEYLASLEATEPEAE